MYWPLARRKIGCRGREAATNKGHHDMKMHCTLKRIIAGTLLSGGVAVAGLGLAAGAAQAQPGPAPLGHWCPGDPPVRGANWDTTVCHDYHWGGPGMAVPVEGPMAPPMCGPVPCGLFP